MTIDVVVCTYQVMEDLHDQKSLYYKMNENMLNKILQLNVELFDFPRNKSMTHTNKQSDV